MPDEHGCKNSQQNPCKSNPTVHFKNHSLRGSWVAWSVKQLTLDLGSGHDLMVCGIKHHVGIHTGPAWDSLPLSLSPPSLLMHACSFCLSLSQKRQKIIHYDQVVFIPGLQVCFDIHKSINMIHHINERKDKSHMILSIDAENAFGKLHPFLIKTFNKVQTEGAYT